MRIVNFSTYYAANGGGQNMDVSWADACDLFRVPKARLNIDWMAKPANEKDATYVAWLAEIGKAKKDSGYVFWGETRDGKKGKNDIVNHTAVALDYDGMQDKSFVPHPEGINYLLYSTTKHDASDPHYRLIVPLSRPVAGDEYQYIARKLLEQVGMDGIDKSTLDDNRAMGYTVLLKNQEYVYVAVTDKAFLDVDAYLVSGWQDASKWPQLPNETKKIKTAQARIASGGIYTEAPVALTGYAGALCKAYTMHQGIDKFLSDIYVPASENRYTYTGASGTGGLYLISDRACISYHSTDPASDGKVHNLYELIQIHTNYNKKQMTELCKRDPEVIKAYKGVAKVEVDVPECAKNWGDMHAYPATDYGIALRLYDMFHDKVAWATDARCWMMYDSVRWADVDVSTMYKLFPPAQHIMEYFAYNATESADVDAMNNIVYQCQISHYRESALKALKPLIEIKRGDMDSDMWGMNTESGYLQLSNTSEYLLPNSYLQHCCKRAAAGFTEDFVPDEECIRFIEGVLPDEELRLWMQKFMGYCLTGSTREKLAVFLHASGNNGKTVFLQLIKNAFGDYYVQGDDKLITTSRWGGDANSPTPSLASLAGARICLFDEIKAGKRIDSAAFKQLTGASPIKARKLRQDPFEFTPRCKLIIACNDVPVVEDAHDPAMKIRIRICPMTAVFTRKNVDKTIEDKVNTQSWKDTFLYWCYEGLQYYLSDGLDDFSVDTSIDESNMPQLMKLSMKKYFKEADEVGDFVMTYCEVTHDESDFVSFSDLYDLYVKEQKNSFAESKRSFGGKLRKYMDAHGCEESRKFVRAFNGERTLQRGYAGIRFYPDVD